MALAPTLHQTRQADPPCALPLYGHFYGIISIQCPPELTSQCRNWLLPLQYAQITYTAHANRAEEVPVTITTDYLPNSGLNKTITVMVNMTAPVGTHDGLHSLGAFYLSEGLGTVRLEKTAVCAPSSNAIAM